MATNELSFSLETPAAADPTSVIVQAILAMHDKLDAISAKVSVSLPAFIQMPPDGIPYNELGWATIAALGSSVAVVSFQVPTGNNGVIRWLGNEYLGPEFVEGNGS